MGEFASNFSLSALRVYIFVFVFEGLIESTEEATTNSCCCCCCWGEGWIADYLPLFALSATIDYTFFRICLLCGFKNVFIENPHSVEFHLACSCLPVPFKLDFIVSPEL